MRGRGGRHIFCQVCDKDDEIRVVWWYAKNYDPSNPKPNFSLIPPPNSVFGEQYGYWCFRCNVKVKETDRGADYAFADRGYIEPFSFKKKSWIERLRAFILGGD